MNPSEKILRKLIRTQRTPCVQYSIFTKDDYIFQFADGYADVAGHIKVDEQTTFCAYSVTKTFTALAVLQLAEQEKLRITEPVMNYLPGFPYPQNITIKQLLTHTAGVPNPVPLSWIHLEQDHLTFDRNNFFRSVMERHRNLRSGPGERFAYSNLGYVILGELIEAITGSSYETCISDHILYKLALPPAELGFIIDHNLAKGYQDTHTFTYLLLGLMIDKNKFMDKREGRWRRFKNFYVNGPSYGGLIGTNKAFVKYLRELMKQDGPLISGRSKDLLFSENHLNNGKASGMCLAWFTGDLNGKIYFTHAGGGGGYYCEIRLYPEIETGSVIMFNTTGMRDERFLNKVDRYFLS